MTAVRDAGVLVSANIAATTMSQAIGAAVSSVRVANLLGSLGIMMFLLFGGFLLNRDQVPWYCTWIADLSYFNYAYEALAVRTLFSTPSTCCHSVSVMRYRLVSLCFPDAFPSSRQIVCEMLHI